MSNVKLVTCMGLNVERETSFISRQTASYANIERQTVSYSNIELETSITFDIECRTSNKKPTGHRFTYGCYDD
jgi:hypothetical protein